MEILLFLRWIYGGKKKIHIDVDNEPVGTYEMILKEPKDILILTNILQYNRTTSSHLMNDQSSRSHCLASVALM